MCKDKTKGQLLHDMTQKGVGSGVDVGVGFGVHLAVGSFLVAPESF